MLFERVVIAIADDKRRMLVMQVMRAEGFDSLVEARSGSEAIEMLSDDSITGLISDVMLGDIDGWRLARLVRSGALKVNANIPILVVSTTYSERIAEVTAKQYQINRFVPFSSYQILPGLLRNCLIGQGDGVPKSTLLVIEDYSDTIELIERVLGSRFEIEMALDGQAGLEAWKARHHDLVLLDVMLPKMSGNAVLKEILAIDPHQSVVMMTAYGSAERASSLMLQGAADFVGKPFRAEQLRRVCEIAVQREDFMVSNEQFAQRQEALHRETERAQVLVQSLGEGVITITLEGIIEYMNPMAEKICRQPLAAVRGKPFNQILLAFNRVSGLRDKSPVDLCMKSGLRVQGCGEVLFRLADGEELSLDYTASPIHDRSGEVNGVVMVFRDTTSMQLLQEKLAYQASYDMVTGLMNRTEFEKRLDHAIQLQKVDGVQHALCYIDLDQFKLINDTSGHSAGDLLLRQIAELLQTQVRRSRDTFARFGGDEFVLLLENCPTERAADICETLLEAIHEYRFIYDDKTFSLSASIGVVAIDEETSVIHEALSRADAACHLAKEAGRNRLHIYRADDEATIRQSGEMQAVAKIHNALENNLFSLYYQEIAAICDGASPGRHYEILIRMQDGHGGCIVPGFFLPAAERFNLSAKIDRWVIKHTFEWFMRHPLQLNALGCCSINLSGLSLSDKGLYTFIENELIRTGMPPRKFCFEITETSAVANLRQATAFVRALRQLGCAFALDDFGSGMSSYGYLKNLPVDYLKVDGVFVRDVIDDPIDLAMVRSINEIGHVLGLKTIAEYVENQDILEKMKEIGIDYVQGYAIGRPVPLDELGCH